MNILYTYAPFCVAFLLGYFLLHILFARKEPLSFGLHCFCAGGLGLGVCGLLGFVSLLVFRQYNSFFVFGSALIATFAAAAYVELKMKIPVPDMFYMRDWRWSNFLLFLILVGCAVPSWDHSHFYLYGGWDAWQTWNLKAKFIFLGGEKWTNLFHPSLWRSSPHYPLLVPLINCFAYTLHQDVSLTANVLSSFFFSFWTVGLLVYGLMYLTKTRYPLFLGVALLTLPRFIKLSLSQYADIFLSYYLLAAVLALVLAKRDQSLRWVILAGLYLGLLSFTKSEGAAAAFFLALFSVPYFLWEGPGRKKFIFYLAGAALVTGIWTVIFKLFFSTGNMSFTNGLASPESPSTLRRLVIVLYWYYRDYISSAYNGLWMVCTLGLVMGFRRAVNTYLWIIPAFLVSYFAVITFYYYVNTAFPIEWWLQVSLHRINYALIPLACFWVFYALWQDDLT